MLIPFLVAASFAFAAPAFDPSQGSVELHAHPFMKEGMPLIFSGDFSEPMRVSAWDNRMSSQVDAQSLNDSGIQVLVMSAYAHPYMTWSVRDSVRRQLDRTREFVAANPGWVIGTDGHQAAAAVAEGKRIIIQAIEGAAGVLETDADLDEFVGQRGVRIVTFLHLTDDHLGGAAFLPGIKSIFSPWALLGSLFSPKRDATGARLNPNGLSADGHLLAQKLIARGVWLDLAHASDEAQKALEPLLDAAGQPRLYTHTSPRSHLPAERSISDEQIAAVARTQGIVGVMPSEDMLGSWEGSEPGLPALVTLYKSVAARIGPESTVFGSDYNGGVSKLRPTKGTGTSLDQQGLLHIGQVGAVWQALRASGAPVPQPLQKTVHRFLDAWSRLDARKLTAR